MHVFQNKGSLRIVSFVLACGIMWSPGVAAQQSTPVLLSPPKRLLNISPPNASNLSDGSNSQIPGYKAGTDDKTMVSGIVVNPLQAVTANSVGILTMDKGGLGQHMWRGVPIGMAENMLAKSPIRLGSATLLNLVRRIMLSSAEPPKGQSDGESFAVLRIQRLVTIADYSAALTLLSLIPRHGRGEGLLRAEAEIRMLSGDQTAACKLVENEVRRRESTFWQKALVFCQILAKEMERAELGLTLLREVGIDDPVFFRLAEAMFEGKVYKVVGLDNLSPLILAMLSRSKFIVQPASILDMAPNALQVVAFNEQMRVGLRVLAVEKMAQLDMYSDKVIFDLYKKIVVKLPEAKLEAAVGQPSALELRAIKRAQFFAAAERSGIPLVKAEAASQAFKLANQDGIIIAASRLFRTELEKVPVSNEMLWFAGDAFRAAVANGEEERGRAWVAILRRAAALSDEKSGQLKSIIPLAWILNEGDKGPYGKIPSTNQDANRMLLLHALLAGLGYKTPVKQWVTWFDASAKFETTPLPHVGIWFALKALDLSAAQTPVLESTNQLNLSSAKMGRESANVSIAKLQNSTPKIINTVQSKASSLMLIIQAMGGHDPHLQNPILLAELIRSLYGLGLPVEGRNLALEAALGAGF